MPVVSFAAPVAAVLDAVTASVFAPVVAQEGGGGFAGLPLLLIAFVAMYFLLIRPQQKRAKKQRALVQSLGVGDRVITIGGIHGVVRSLDDDTVVLEVAPGTTMTMTRSAVGRRVVDADAESDADSDLAADDED